MCQACERARKQPLKLALTTIGTAMKGKSPKQRECLDATLGELLGGKKSDSEDIFDQGERESLKARP